MELPERVSPYIFDVFLGWLGTKEALARGQGSADPFTTGGRLVQLENTFRYFNVNPKTLLYGHTRAETAKRTPQVFVWKDSITACGDEI